MSTIVNSFNGDADLLVSDDLFDRARSAGSVEAKANQNGEAYRVTLVHLGSSEM